MKTIAAIPTRYWPDTLRDLVVDLIMLNEHDEIWILDNSDEDRSKYPHWGLGDRLKVIPCEGLTIYQMWNLAWMQALESSFEQEEAQEVNLAILNDDISIAPFPFLATMRHWLRDNPETAAVCPDYGRRVAQGFYASNAAETVSGSFKDGGLCGWAFMFKAEWHITHDVPLVDEQFEWWCGDDDLFRQLGMKGKLRRIPGLPLDHVGGLSEVQRPELQLAKGRDIERFVAKYGRW